MIEQLYEKLYGELLGYLTLRTGNASAAEDIAQETFLRALCHGDTLEELSFSQCRAWLYRTAKNLMIDGYRRRDVSGKETPETAAETDFTRIEIELACAVLSPQDKSIFYLRHFEGYNATEIGEMLGLSPANVRMRLKAARTKLKKEIGTYE